MGGAIIHGGPEGSAVKQAKRPVQYPGEARQGSGARVVPGASEQRIGGSASGSCLTGEWSWNLDNDELQWSPAVYQILDLPEAQGPSGEAFLSCVHPADENLVRRWLALARKGKVPPTTDFRTFLADGRLRHIQATAPRQKCAESGAGVVQIAGTISDFTEIRERSTRACHAEAMTALGSFAGGLAHDYNNFLQVIAGNVELLARSLEGDDDARECLDEIVRATSDCTALTQRLALIGRPQGNSGAPIINVSRRVAELRPELGARLGADIELELLDDAQCGHVRIEGTDLDQLLFELCQNARDAMPDGGAVCLSLGEVEVDREFTGCHPSSRTGAHLRIRLSDGGEGIHPSVRSRVFEPFFTPHPRRRGRGLGLTICRGIVHHAGGVIELDDAAAGGARFTIYLPLALPRGSSCPDEELAERRTDTHNAVESCAPTVLVVDDEARVRRLARKALEGDGYRVLEAESGAVALDMLKLEPTTTTTQSHAASDRGAEACGVDLLLSDVVMPEMDGLELVARVAASLPQVNCVLMSGHLGERSMMAFGRDIAQMGVAVPTLLRKPFTLAELSKAVAFAVSGRD